MKKKTMIIFNTIAIVLTLACTIALTYGWYVNSDNISVSLAGGSAGGYFRGGKGTSDDPYEISNSRHMYNFAWLQNNGKYIDDSENQTKLYFELVNADGNNGIIDMESIIIPPIGNDKYPFIGEFNGNGCSLKNLVVSTDYNVIYNGAMLKSQSYVFSNAVGLFGMTGTGSVVKNFILDDPTVEVFGTDSNYGSAGSKVAGLAIGYVENKASSIGVKKGVLSVNRAEYSTFNSIIGNIKEGIGSDITGGNTGGGEGNEGDTGQFIPEVILDAVNNGVGYSNYATTVSSTSLTFANPLWLVQDKDNPQLSLGSFSFTVGSATTITKGTSLEYFYFTDTIATGFPTSNRLGSTISYYQHNTNNPIYFDSSKNTSDIAKEYRNYIKNGDTVMDEIATYLNWQKSPSNSDFSASGGYTYKVVSENNELIGTSDYNVYSNSIKIKISSSSTKIFCIASCTDSSTSRMLGVYKMSDDFGEYYDFATDSGSISEKDLPGSDGSVGLNKQNDPILALELPKKSSGNEVVVGCLFDISNYGPGTYTMSSTNSSIKLYYLSVTGVAEDADASTGEVNSTVGLSAIDFIYDNVSINQEKINDIEAFNFVVTTGDTTNFYQISGTIIYFELTSSQNDIVLYFKREEDEIGSIVFNVKYYNILPNASFKDKVTLTGGASDLTITQNGITSPDPFT